MVFSSRSSAKNSKKAKKNDEKNETSTSGFLHSPLRRSSKHKSSSSSPAPSSAPIPIVSSTFLELPSCRHGGATSSASTTPSQFSDHSPLPPSRSKNDKGGDQFTFPQLDLQLQSGPYANGRATTSDSPLPSPWAEEVLQGNMSYEFSPHQLQTLKEAFNFFDIDSDGRITNEELHSVFKFLGNPVTEDQVDLMISDADVDGNGTVELNEFLRMMKRYYHKHEAPSTEEEEMLEAFKAFDHNGDSFIDFDEIKKTMHFLGEAVSDEEVKAMIREADADKDGRINFEEFKKMMSLMRMGPLSQAGATSSSK